MFAPTFRIQVPAELKRETALAVHRFGLLIATGGLIAETYYRRNRHTTPDKLLEQTGIMHIHPRGPGTSESLFLVQYEKNVLILEVSDHSHFAISPLGHLLLSFHEGSVLDQEQEASRLERQRQDAWNSRA